MIASLSHNCFSHAIHLLVRAACIARAAARQERRATFMGMTVDMRRGLAHLPPLRPDGGVVTQRTANPCTRVRFPVRSEEHTSELQSLMRISYAVFCLNKKTQERTTI